jgi:hypothetical protein
VPLCASRTGGAAGRSRAAAAALTRDAAAAFRLVEFHTGSGIATLESVRVVDELGVLDAGEGLSLSTLRALLGTIEAGERMPDPILESLGRARRAIGDDGSFGVAIGGDSPLSRTVIDEQPIDRLRRPAGKGGETALRVTGRLHMIETDQPQRRIGIRAQDGVDWTCSYPDDLHRLVTTLIEQLVRVTGTGRRLTATAGRLRIEHIEAIPEHVQDVLFTDEPVPLEQLRAEQGIERLQGGGVRGRDVARRRRSAIVLSRRRSASPARRWPPSLPLRRRSSSTRAS